MDDCLIVGAGIVGLSLAWELAGAGLRVRVLERTLPGREASWAAAGLFPPPNRFSSDPLDRFTTLSMDLHAAWAPRLQEETGIDTGYRRTGAIYLARSAAEAAAVQTTADRYRSQRTAVERLSPADLSRLEPNLSSQQPVIESFLLPDEHQLRNPRHLRALVIACARRGVVIESDTTVHDVAVDSGRVTAVETSHGSFPCGSVCLAAGAWSGGLAGRIGLSLPIKPIRGQIALLASPAPPIAHILNEGDYYLVPRPDGRTLVGSTVEDAGFDCRPTAEGIGQLLDFALSLVPALRSASLERSWAGLRPGSADGLPYLDRVPNLANAFVAAGHFRAGLILAPATAVVMSRLIQGLDPGCDLTPFRIGRPVHSAD